MESVNTLFPVFMKLDRLNVLVVGGGAVAEEKLRFIFKSSPNAQIHVLAPMIRKDVLMYRLKYPTQIYFTKRKFENKDVLKHDIVIAATNNNEVNIKIFRAAKRNKILINVADTPKLCDFYMGSIVTKGDLKIAISTNGKSPTFAKRFRQMLESSLPDDLKSLLVNLRVYRDQLKGDFSYKVKELNKLTENLVKN